MSENKVVVYSKAQEALILRNLERENVAMIMSSPFRPAQFKTMEEGIIAWNYCKAINVNPWVGIYEISVIKNRPSQSANLLMSRINQNYPDADFYIAENNDKRAIYMARQKPSQPYSKFEYTYDMAKKMGYLDKIQYTNQIENMLLARAKTKMVRAIFPMATFGTPYDKDEIENFVKEEQEPLSKEETDQFLKSNSPVIDVDYEKINESIKTGVPSKEDDYKGNNPQVTLQIRITNAFNEAKEKGYKGNKLKFKKEYFDKGTGEIKPYGEEKKEDVKLGLTDKEREKIRDEFMEDYKINVLDKDSDDTVLLSMSEYYETYKKQKGLKMSYAELDTGLEGSDFD